MIMQLRFFNSLSNTVENFEPVEPGTVRMYSCGPTVYDYAHIGHARCFIIYDVLVRHLRASGMAVEYVRNITDIDDKILKRAKEAGEEPRALADRMTTAFGEDMAALRNVKPDEEPRVSDHLEGIYAMVTTLIDKGHAYVADGDVYFSVRSAEGYGRLSGRKLDDMAAGASGRLDEAQAQRKKDPADFALWKGAPLDEWGWESPWGHGRPGWHIECSVMSTAKLGETLDLLLRVDRDAWVHRFYRQLDRVVVPTADRRILVLSPDPQETGRSSSSERVSAIFGRNRKQPESRTRTKDEDENDTERPCSETRTGENNRVETDTG